MFDGISTVALEARFSQLAYWETIVDRTKGVANWSEEYAKLRRSLFGQDDPDDVWNSMSAIDDELAARSA